MLVRNQIENRHEQSKVVPFLQDSHYFYERGLKAYRERNLSVAVKMFERALHLNNRDEDVLLQLAMTYTELSEYEKSNKLLQYILDEINPHFVAGYYFIANNYAHLGLFQEAYKYALTYEQEDEEGEFQDENDELLEMLAIEGEEAITDQDDLIVKQEVAKSYLEKGQFQEAISELQELIHQYPEFWSAYNNLALAHFYLGEVEEASRYLSLVLERNPGNLHALCNLLVFYFYERKDEDVEQLVRKLSNIHPILAEHRYKLGATFSLVGHYDEAFKWLYHLYRTGFQGDDTFYYWLSYSAYHTGHIELAEKCWEKVLVFNPEKAGAEPWGPSSSSKELYKQLYEIYTISKRKDAKEIISTRTFHTPIEKEAIEFVLSGGKSQTSTISFAFRVADLLQNERNEEEVIGWFYILLLAVNREFKLQNPEGWAAAYHYLYVKEELGENVTKTSIAHSFQLSVQTLSKYVKKMEELLSINDENV